MIQFRERVLQLLQARGPELHGLLYRLTLRQDVAEDLLQDLAVRLLTAPGFAQARDPAAYAFRVAIRLATDWRLTNRRRRREVALPNELTDRSAPPGTQGMCAEELERLLDEISRLPTIARQVMVLRFLEQKSYEESAVIMARSPHHVRALCHKAIRQIQRRLGPRLEGGDL